MEGEPIAECTEGGTWNHPLPLCKCMYLFNNGNWLYSSLQTSVANAEQGYPSLLICDTFCGVAPCQRPLLWFQLPWATGIQCSYCCAMFHCHGGLKRAKKCFEVYLPYSSKRGVNMVQPLPWAEKQFLAGIMSLSLVA